MIKIDIQVIQTDLMKNKKLSSHGLNYFHRDFATLFIYLIF